MAHSSFASIVRCSSLAGGASDWSADFAAGTRAAAAAASPVAGFVVARHLVAPLGPAGAAAGEVGEDLPSAPVPPAAGGGTDGITTPAAAEEEEEEEDFLSMPHARVDVAPAVVAAH
jgi:hypothetical protein